MSKTNELRKAVKEGAVIAVSVFVAGSGAATAANYPPKAFVVTTGKIYKVIGVSAQWTTAAGAGTLNVLKMGAGVAIGSGTSILSSTISTAGTANTTVNGTLATTVGVTYIGPGDSLGVVAAGTLTGLTDTNITILLQEVNISNLPD